MKHLIDLIFPKLCISCQENNMTKGDFFCISCSQKLNFTDHFEEKKNAFTKRFYGRIDVESAAALFWYTKGDIVQKMIFSLKYDNQKYIATALGKIIANRIKQSDNFSSIDLIVPVPLHPKKKHLRGFNQSELLVRSISKELSIPAQMDLLIKNDNTISQTKKSRMDRFLSLEKGFGLNPKYNISNKNVLLIDDVLTTGSTLEACGLEILKSEVNSLSMITIAIGKH